MESCAAVRATNRKQLNGGESLVVWTVLLSEVTLFEYNVSTIFHRRACFGHVTLKFYVFCV